MYLFADGDELNQKIERYVNNEIDAFNQTMQVWMAEMIEKRMSDTMNSMKILANNIIRHHSEGEYRPRIANTLTYSWMCCKLLSLM